MSPNIPDVDHQNHKIAQTNTKSFLYSDASISKQKQCQFKDDINKIDDQMIISTDAVAKCDRKSDGFEHLVSKFRIKAEQNRHELRKQNYKSDENQRQTFQADRIHEYRKLEQQTKQHIKVTPLKEPTEKLRSLEHIDDFNPYDKKLYEFENLLTRFRLNAEQIRHKLNKQKLNLQKYKCDEIQQQKCQLPIKRRAEKTRDHTKIELKFNNAYNKFNPMKELMMKFRCLQQNNYCVRQPFTTGMEETKYIIIKQNHMQNSTSKPARVQ